MTFPRASYWFVIALAIVMVLAHICAGPLHAYAGAITTHEGHESHHGGSEAERDAGHAASCDALKTPSVGPAVAVLLPVGTVPVLVALQVRRLTELDACVATGSPPLFLLHAAFLI